MQWSVFAELKEDWGVALHRPPPPSPTAHLIRPFCDRREGRPHSRKTSHCTVGHRSTCTAVRKETLKNGESNHRHAPVSHGSPAASSPRTRRRGVAKEKTSSKEYARRRCKCHKDAHTHVHNHVHTETKTEKHGTGMRERRLRREARACPIMANKKKEGKGGVCQCSCR